MKVKTSSHAWNLDNYTQLAVKRSFIFKYWKAETIVSSMWCKVLLVKYFSTLEKSYETVFVNLFTNKLDLLLISLTGETSVILGSLIFWLYPVLFHEIISLLLCVISTTKKIAVRSFSYFVSSFYQNPKFSSHKILWKWSVWFLVICDKNSRCV